MSPVTLPGDLVSPVAGTLLRRGSCVLIPAEDDRNELRPALVRVSGPTYTGIIDSDGTTQIMGSQYVLLDLSDPAGMDRATRWYAEHGGYSLHDVRVQYHNNPKALRLACLAAVGRLEKA